jgi:hypothetical protein
MIDFKLLSHSLDNIVDKVSTLVTHQNPYTSKSSDHFLKQEVCGCLCTAVLIGVASSHLVKYFVIAMIYLAPDLFAGGWIGPTKSIAHLSNTYKVTCGLRGISYLLLGLPIL